MRDAENWFQHYAAHQREPTLRSLHWLTVPCLALSVIGLLWSLPVPAVFARISPAMNWGSAFAMAAIVYYFIMSIPLGVGMTAMLAMMLAAVHWLDGLPPPLWATSTLLLGGALVLGRAGRRQPGGRGGMLRDLHLLMIGPAWLLARLYRRLGIPY